MTWYTISFKNELNSNWSFYVINCVIFHSYQVIYTNTKSQYLNKFLLKPSSCFRTGYSWDQKSATHFLLQSQYTWKGFKKALESVFYKEYFPRYYPLNSQIINYNDYLKFGVLYGIHT